MSVRNCRGWISSSEVCLGAKTNLYFLTLHGVRRFRNKQSFGQSVSWQTGAANLIIGVFPMLIFLSFRAQLQVIVKVSGQGQEIRKVEKYQHH